MDIEERTGPPRGILLVIGVVGIIVGAALASVFIFGLQPAYHPPGSFVCPSGDTCITIVAGAVNPYSGYSGTPTMLYGYSPANVTVVIGVNNTVVWDNADVTFHTATSNPTDPAQFNSACISSKVGPCSPATPTSYQFKFTVPGTYVYHCDYHAWMEGVVVVLASSSSS